MQRGRALRPLNSQAQATHARSHTPNSPSTLVASVFFNTHTSIKPCSRPRPHMRSMTLPRIARCLLLKLLASFSPATGQQTAGPGSSPGPSVRVSCTGKHSHWVDSISSPRSFTLPLNICMDADGGPTKCPPSEGCACDFWWGIDGPPVDGLTAISSQAFCREHASQSPDTTTTSKFSCDGSCDTLAPWLVWKQAFGEDYGCYAVFLCFTLSLGCLHGCKTAGCIKKLPWDGGDQEGGATGGDAALLPSAPQEPAPLVQSRGGAQTQHAGADPPQLQNHLVNPVHRREAPRGTMMEVQVPAGVSAGQSVQLMVPSGDVFQVQVPAGLSAGMVFEVAIP